MAKERVLAIARQVVAAQNQEARLEVSYHLDIYLNLDRRHSAMGYRLPYQFDRDCPTSVS